MAIQDEVRAKYGQVAKSGLSTAQNGVKAVAQAFGYSGGDLDSIPAEANMGLSCGNPTAFASLKAGEVVVDLGSGGGLDVFLAAQRVGPQGKAIGIDMTPEMVALAQRNAAKLSPDARGNVEFHLATIDKLPLPDNSVDCIISNCVLNLAPDKPAVFREMVRVLKPGGRVAVSDIALKKPLPAEIGESLMAYIACIAGAISIEEYQTGLKAAGFAAVEIQDSGANLNVYRHVEGQSGCCSPTMTSEHSGLNVLESGCCGGGEAAAQSEVHAALSDLLSRYDVNEYAASVKVYAVKQAK